MDDLQRRIDGLRKWQPKMTLTELEGVLKLDRGECYATYIREHRPGPIRGWILFRHVSLTNC